MKRQIDPNLNGFGGDDFLEPFRNEDTSGLHISGETAAENKVNPDFKVIEKDDDIYVVTSKGLKYYETL